MKAITILLVDDDETILEIYSRILEIKGFQVIACNNGNDAIKVIRTSEIKVVIADIIMPKMTGMELLKAIKRIAPGIEVIMLTAEGSIAGAVEAVKQGAFSYFVKPANIDELLISINRAAELSDIKAENDNLKEHIANISTSYNFIGRSKVAMELREKAKLMGNADSPVLITGETGTGKEVLANLVHRNSRRANKPFVCINCGALNENLIESELFGNEKGAFTGAESMKKGYFEVADGGTIFFDEIGELSFAMQVKLLRVIQEKSFERVGGTKSIKSDFRIIAATNRDLKEEVAENHFRADLYYRINVLPIEIPPLRERKEDIEILCDNFRAFYSHEMNKRVNPFNEKIIERLRDYSWPGNVRELRNIIERLVVLSVNGEVDIYDLPEEIRGNDELLEPDNTIKSVVESAEFEYIKDIIDQCDGNITRAAEIIGVSRQHLYRKINKYNIEYK